MRKSLKRNLTRNTAIFTSSLLLLGAVGNVEAKAFRKARTNADWNVSFQAGAPSTAQQSFHKKIDAYSGGYQTHCSKIAGANDRYFQVKVGSVNWKITSKGYSRVYTPKWSGEEAVKVDIKASGTLCSYGNGQIGYPL